MKNTFHPNTDVFKGNNPRRPFKSALNEGSLWKMHDSGFEASRKATFITSTTNTGATLMNRPLFSLRNERSSLSNDVKMQKISQSVSPTFLNDFSPDNSTNLHREPRNTAPYRTVKVYDETERKFVEMPWIGNEVLHKKPSGSRLQIPTENPGRRVRHQEFSCDLNQTTIKVFDEDSRRFVDMPLILNESPLADASCSKNPLGFDSNIQRTASSWGYSSNQENTLRHVATEHMNANAGLGQTALIPTFYRGQCIEHPVLKAKGPHISKGFAIKKNPHSKHPNEHFRSKVNLSLQNKLVSRQQKFDVPFEKRENSLTQMDCFKGMERFFPKKRMVAEEPRFAEQSKQHNTGVISDTEYPNRNPYNQLSPNTHIHPISSNKSHDIFFPRKQLWNVQENKSSWPEVTDDRFLNPPLFTREPTFISPNDLLAQSSDLPVIQRGLYGSRCRGHVFNHSDFGGVAKTFRDCAVGTEVAGVLCEEILSAPEDVVNKEKEQRDRWKNLHSVSVPEADDYLEVNGKEFDCENPSVVCRDLDADLSDRCTKTAYSDQLKNLKKEHHRRRDQKSAAAKFKETLQPGFDSPPVRAGDLPIETGNNRIGAVGVKVAKKRKKSTVRGGKLETEKSFRELEMDVSETLASSFSSNGDRKIGCAK